MIPLRTTKATLAILLCFFISSCSKDDDEDGIENISYLFGVWEPIFFEGWINYNGDKQTWGYTINATSPITTTNYPRMEFLENNTYNTYDYRKKNSSWELVESGTYSINGNMIYTTIGDYESFTTIKSLKANKMKLEVYEEWHNHGGEYANSQVTTYKKIE